VNMIARVGLRAHMSAREIVADCGGMRDQGMGTVWAAAM
jgi:hypothetical protein